MEKETSEKKLNGRLDYWWKAIKWWLLNAGFGWFPLGFMYLIKYLTDGKIGGEQIEHLIYEGGIIVFVAIAIMGAVMGDYLISGLRSKGHRIFMIYLFPLLLLGFVSVEFMLICTNNMEKEAFALLSPTTIIVTTLSFTYSTLVKGNLYLRENIEQKKSEK